MPSQEEYLDNLLKGIETENTETEVNKGAENDRGRRKETAKAPETPEPVEESGTQVDMSDMDDLLQSALDAQKADSSEQETEASQPVAENTAILPEETALCLRMKLTGYCSRARSNPGMLRHRRATMLMTI